MCITLLRRSLYCSDVFHTVHVVIKKHVEKCFLYKCMIQNVSNQKISLCENNKESCRLKSINAVLVRKYGNEVLFHLCLFKVLQQYFLFWVWTKKTFALRVTLVERIKVTLSRDFLGQNQLTVAWPENMTVHRWWNAAPYRPQGEISEHQAGFKIL